MKIRKITGILAALLVAALLTGLCSCAMGGELLKTVEEGDLKFELYGKGSAISYVTVYKDGSKTGKYKVRGESASASSNHGFELIDLNFDGLTDFRVITSSSANTVYYKNYLANSDGSFYSSKELDALTDLTVDTEKKTLTCKTYEKIWEGKNAEGELVLYTLHWGTHVYEWHGGSLYELSREETIYYSETDIYCVVTYERADNGSFEILNEDWIDASQYEKDENK